MMQKLPTISPKSTVREAMQVIDTAASRIALLVDAQDRLLGTLSDGDLRRALLAGASLQDAAAPLANRDFVSAGPQDGRAQVLELMRARSLSQIPIIDARGRLLGLHLLHEIIGQRPRPNLAVIMAGGRGERLRPLTDSMPKPMLPVAGRPILERIVLHLVGSGIREIYIAINYLGEQIERHFGDGSEFGCKIKYLHEDKPLGTGGALSLLPAQPTDPLLVLNGDLLSQFDLGALLDTHQKNKALATLAVHQHRYTLPFGVIEEDEKGRLRGLREKPTERWAVNAGIYVLEPALLARIPGDRLYPLPALIEDCLHKGEPVAVHHIEDDWIDVGLPAQLKKARGE